MKRVSLLPFLLGVLLPLSLPAAELRVPEPFNVLQINDAPYGATLQREKRLDLAPGRHVIVLEYDQIFPATFGDSHERIESKPFALVLNVGTEPTLIVQDPKLESSDDARRYAKAPSLRVLDSAQREIAIQLLPVQAVGDAFVTAVNAVAPATASATKPASSVTTVATPSQSGTTPTVATPTVAAPASSPVPTSQDPLQQLQYWWQQATPEQRAAFLQQIVR